MNNIPRETLGEAQKTYKKRGYYLGENSAFTRKKKFRLSWVKFRDKKFRERLLSLKNYILFEEEK